ncbi:hypothetical protein HRbin06_00213 [archaeon HR06]|nr:hypothetical protein HRbin06_00213 [archaeon HR06]
MADDLTGACDSSSQFKKYGFKTLVLSKYKKVKGDIVAFNLNSRDLKMEEVYKKARDICLKLKRDNIDLIYLKIDSTLRGNFGGIIKAVMDTYNFPYIFIAPAYPLQGRIVLKDRLYVRGEPLITSEFKEELKVKKDRVSEIVKAQVGEEVQWVEKELKDLKFRIFVFDSVNFSDLERIVKLGKDLGALLCGSAGLAEALAKYMGKRKRKICVINGSRNKVSRVQTERLFGFEKLEIKVPKIYSKEKIREELKKIILKEDMIFELKEDLGSKKAVKEIIKGLINITVNKFDSYVIIGGDTLNQVCEGLKASGFKILKELEPGIPLMEFLDGKLKGFKVVSKAGGFGDENTLVRIVNYLRQI